MKTLTLLLAVLAASAAPTASEAALPRDSALSAAAAGGTARLSGARRWACFYGSRMSAAAWSGLDLAVVDPDHFVRPSTAGPAAVAYVSAGEVEADRWFYKSLKKKNFVVEPNPDWPGAYRVDVRDPDWHRLLLDTVVSSAIARGYDGVMLDTLDTAEYLESSAPVRYAGSRDAAVGFVLELRRRRPEALILINNGLALLDSVGDAIDGVLVEDLYTRCRPEPGPCGPTPEDAAAPKEALLRKFAARTGKPVFVLLYSRTKDQKAPWVVNAVRRSRAAGFFPYLASPTLLRLGVTPPEADP